MNAKAKKKTATKSTTKTKAAAKTAAKKAAAAKPKAAAKTTAKKAAAAKPEAAAKKGASGLGTRDKPWVLSTPSGGSTFEAFRDASLDPPALVVKVGKTELRYHLRCIEDLHAMLKKHGDWMLLGSADEQKPAADGTVEARGRSPKNPVGGFYGIKKGLRGRFGMYVPPVMKVLGLAEVEDGPRNNRMRAL